MARSPAALSRFFEEPARALARNALIVAIGFVPLIFASLAPYKVVGVLPASIMVLSWLATLVLLPAVISFLQCEVSGAEGSGGRRVPHRLRPSQMAPVRRATDTEDAESDR